MSVREKWNRIYNNRRKPSPPAPVLTEFAHLLPESGRALDLACGLGSNALWLARRGFTVDAWDISDVAIRRVLELAGADALDIQARQTELCADDFETSRYTLIVVSRFLDRALTHAIMRSLEPGGLLCYQTFTREKTGDAGPSNPDYLLGRNELLSLFEPLRVLVYFDEGTTGNPEQNFRNESVLIAQKQA